MKFFLFLSILISSSVRNCFKLSLFRNIITDDMSPFHVWYICKTIFITSKTSCHDIYAVHFQPNIDIKTPKLYIEVIHQVIIKNLTFLYKQQSLKGRINKFDKLIKKYIHNNKYALITTEKILTEETKYSKDMENEKYSEIIVHLVLLYYIDIIMNDESLRNTDIWQIIWSISYNIDGYYENINSPGCMEYLTHKEFVNTFFVEPSDEKEYFVNSVEKDGSKIIHYLNCSIADLYVKQFIVNYQMLKFNFKCGSELRESDFEIYKKNLDNLFTRIERDLGVVFNEMFDFSGHCECNTPIINQILLKSEFVYIEHEEYLVTILKPLFYYLMNSSEDILLSCMIHARSQIRKYHCHLNYILRLYRSLQPKTIISIYRIK